MKVSKCCGRRYTMEVVRTIILASDRVIKPQTPGQIPEGTPICCGCGEPCGIVMEGEHTKPYEGGIYCQTCARRMAQRIPRGLMLRYPAQRDNIKATCWGCGKTTGLQEASELVKQ